MTDESKVLWENPDGSEITVEIVLVTPERAYEWLGHNIKNRHLNEQSVIRIARDMKADRYELNGETLKFDHLGNLLDGQHRLTALVTAEVSIPMIVVRGLRPENWNTVDTGTKRSFANVLQRNEFQNTTSVAAVARAVASWKEDRRGYFPIYTNAEMMDILEKEPHISDSMPTVSKVSDNFKIGAAIPGLCWWLFDGIDSEANERFWDRLCSEYEHRKGDPISTLRKKLMSGDELVGAGTTPRRTFTLAIIIKAWNAYRKGKDIEILNWGRNGEKFPEPI